MPPTVSRSLGHPTTIVSRAFADRGPHSNSIHRPQTRRLASTLSTRNYSSNAQAEGQPRNTITTVSDTTSSPYIPYEPPSSLHPTIIPGPIIAPETNILPGSRPSSHSRPHINTAVIVIAFSLIFTSVLCGLALIMLTGWFKKRKFSQPLFWFRSDRNPGLNPGEEPAVFIGVDYASGADAVVHDTTLDLDLDRKSISGSVTNGDGPPCIPPSVISAESLALRPDYSTQTMTGFQERVDTEEADITMAIGIAMRDCTYSGSELSTISQSPKISAADKRREIWDVKDRTRQGSNASDSTEPTTESGVFSIAPTTRSSLTSITEIVVHDSELEDFDIDEILEMEMDTQDLEFEVARAQTQSMEIKRGVLVDWCAQRASLSPIVEEIETTVSLRSPSFASPSSSAVPSLVVTCPSMTTISLIRPSYSSVSVDLNEFPFPPSAFDYGRPFEKFDMVQVVPEFASGMDTCSMHRAC